MFLYGKNTKKKNEKSNTSVIFFCKTRVFGLNFPIFVLQNNH